MSSVPTGLAAQNARYPALKRRAIFTTCLRHVSIAAIPAGRLHPKPSGTRNTKYAIPHQNHDLKRPAPLSDLRPRQDDIGAEGAA